MPGYYSGTAARILGIMAYFVSQMGTPMKSIKMQRLWETPASSDRQGEFTPHRIDVASQRFVEHIVLDIRDEDRKVVSLVLTYQDSQTLASLLIQSRPGEHAVELLGLLGVLLAALRNSGVNRDAVAAAVRSFLRREVQ